MNLVRIKISDWRSTAARELLLQPGLNILRGENEAGKSTIVEAIHKALYWDHTARKAKNDNIDFIAPANNPNARPTVELELLIGPARVTVTKTVSSKKDHRQCTLKVLDPQGGERTFRDAQAEEKLRELLARSHAMPGLDWSEQSEGYAYLAESLPIAACAALSIGKDGTIMPSARLEQLRKRIGAARDEQLNKQLKQPLADSAKAGTLAYERRQTRQQKREELATVKSQLAKVDELRRNILKLDREAAGLGPQLEQAKALRKTRQAQQKRQKEAEGARAKCSEMADACQRDLAAAEKRVEEIESLRKQRDSQTLSGDRLDEQLKQLEPARQAAFQHCDRVKGDRIRAEGSLASVRRRIDAHTSRLEVFQQTDACTQAQQSFDQSEALQSALAQAEKAFDAIGPWPTGEDIGRWRKAFAELSALKRDAMSSLQLNFEPTRPLRIEWNADSGPTQALTAEPGAPATLGAVRSLRLEIEGLGRLQISCGATELAELLKTIQQQADSLNQSLSAHGAAVDELPGGFDRLEEIRIRGEEAERGVKEARRQAGQAGRELGDRDRLRKQLKDAQQKLTSAITRLETLKSLVPEGLDADGLRAEIERLKDEERAQQGSYQQLVEAGGSAERELAALDKKYSLAEQQLSQARAAAGEASRRLLELERDGLADDVRRQNIHQLRVKTAGLESEVAHAQQAVTDLGPAISDDELAAQDTKLVALDGKVGDINLQLAEKRAELRTICGNDPQGELQRLEQEIGDLDARLVGEERKLGALALLDGVLAQQRQSLARLIAKPLNERIAPWLRQIRGLPTELEIDADTSRITRIITDRGGYRDELPFEEHSEGLKGQVGLLVRLTLARLTAEQNGGQHFVVLDDPLTETSPFRRPEMFRILQQAAEHLQILLVTCHEDAVALLPGHVIAF
ncbi:MAG TPA: AAA family ATPase [Pirellulales bacterium]|nr:AAA family ATPase [Pirellulales bacterium]